MVKQGILKPVEFAEWAVPIVPVVKSNKSSVCICGDFKLTVNKASKLDQYPIPRMKDLDWRKNLHQAGYVTSESAVATG